MKIDKCGVCEKQIEKGETVLQILSMNAYCGSFNGQVLRGQRTETFTFIGSDNRNCHLECLKTALNCLDYKETSSGERTGNLLDHNNTNDYRTLMPKVDNV